MKFKKIDHSRVETYVDGKRVIFCITKNNEIIASYKEFGFYKKEHMIKAKEIAKKILIYKRKSSQLSFF